MLCMCLEFISHSPTFYYKTNVRGLHPELKPISFCFLSICQV